MIHLLESILAHVAHHERQEFLARCTPEFAKVAEPQFDKISNQLAPHLLTGSTLTHLGELKRKNNSVTVFRVAFGDNSDEFVAMISESGGKVSSLVIK